MEGKFDGIVFDLGVSSMQIDEGERGFSFIKNGDLDMRMNPSSENTLNAQVIINSFTEREIADILFQFGEEKFARRIAAKIVDERKKNKIEDTITLANIIKSAVPPQKKETKDEFKQIHPATKSFQALRIYVNNELQELKYGLHAAENLLQPGGILAVISYHSLEDRIVKDFVYRCAGKRPQEDFGVAGEEGGGEERKPSFQIVNKSVIIPSNDEIQKNPRSRSAKLRLAQKK